MPSPGYMSAWSRCEAMPLKRAARTLHISLRTGAAIVAASLMFAAGVALAQSGPSAPPDRVPSAGFRFGETTGEELYASVCQACHMSDGKGATGAGTYPALAGNQNLAAGRYPVTVVLHGLRGMPPVGYFMTDDQVAAVVNYVRTHFGNNYSDAVNAGDVKAVRK
jgi:mono/diheme cytochrome c family protein